MILERTVLLFVVDDRRPSRTAVTMPVLAVRSVALVLMEKPGACLAVFYSTFRAAWNIFEWEARYFPVLGIVKTVP